MARTRRPIVERPERSGRIQHLRRRHDGHQRPVRGQPAGRHRIRTDRILIQALMRLPDHRRRPGGAGTNQHDPPFRRLVRGNLGQAQPPPGRRADHHRGRQGRTDLLVQRMAPRQGLRMLRAPTAMARGENRNELRPADGRRARLRQADGPPVRPQPHQPLAHEPRGRRIPHHGPHGGVGRILFRAKALVHRREQGRVQQQHVEEPHPGDQRHQRRRGRQTATTAAGAAGVHGTPFGHAQDHGHARRLADPRAGRLPGHHVGQSDQRRGDGISGTTPDPHRRQAERGLRTRTQTGHGHRRGTARRRELDTRLHARRAPGMGPHEGDLRRGARRRVHEDRGQGHRLRRLRRRTRTTRPEP